MVKQLLNSQESPNVHGKFFYQYQKNILKKLPISYSLLEPGMIVEINYRKETFNKKYIVFVITPFRVPGYKDIMLHGLDLSQILPVHLDEVINKLGLDQYAERLYKARGEKYSKAMITIGEDYIPNVYNRIFKPIMHTKLNDSYRMFKKTDIIRINAVQYNWNPKLVKKYLVEDKPTPKGERSSETP